MADDDKDDIVIAPPDRPFLVRAALRRAGADGRLLDDAEREVMEALAATAEVEEARERQRAHVQYGSSPGGWPSDGPQPPTMDFMLELVELSQSRSEVEYSCPGQGHRDHAVHVEMTWTEFEQIDKPMRIVARLQRAYGA